jgi:hypothetical protein
MKKLGLKQLWLVLSAYGVWFAILSGMEEVLHDKYWKVAMSLFLGLLVYYIIEIRNRKEN